MSKKERNKLILFAVVGIVAIVLTWVLLRKWDEKQRQEDIEGAGSAVSANVLQTLTYGDSEYSMKKHMETVLLIGVDKLGAVEENDLFYNQEQADFLAVLVLDNAAKTCQIVHLNRDTMTDVPWLSVDGKRGGTTRTQLALAHNYGTGGEDSCLNTVEAVEILLKGVPINYYLSTKMDAVGVANDLVGGVSVTIRDDFSALDPELKMGETVTLHGQQALYYVRARMAVGDGSNLSRMERQREYIHGFAESARRTMSEDADFVTRLYDALDQYLVTNISVDAFSSMAERLRAYELLETVTPPGEAREGEEFMEFELDQNGLIKLLTEVFYDKK